MENKINLGSIQMPINAATKTFAILAKRGAGKTYTAGVLAEEFAKNGIPFVVFDPIDVWYGLRLAADGKSKGLPVVVFGNEHADIKLDRDMGRKIAQEIVKTGVSCVISTMGIPGGKTAERHLIAEFAEELLAINNTPRHVLIEEAHEFVPQRVFGGLGKTFNAVSNLVVMGRNRGIGVTLINQRAATINKDVLTQLDSLLAFRNVSPQDRKALKEWVEHHSAEGDFEKFMASLPSLPTGEGWIWSPEFLNIFKRIKIRKRETFHPDREKIGATFVVPELDSFEISDFISRFNESMAKKTPTPAKAKVVRKDGNAGSPAPASMPTPTMQELHDLKNEYESKLIVKDTTIIEKDRQLRELSAKLAAIQKIVGIAGVTATNSVLSSSVELWLQKLGSGLAGRIFKFISENSSREFTREQICLAVGVAANAGHTSNEFAKLSRNNLIVRNGNLYRANQNL